MDDRLALLLQWKVVDTVLTLGLASKVPALRVSRPLRGIRKATAQATGLHGFVSGKPRMNPRDNATTTTSSIEMDGEELDDEDLGRLRRRISAIQRAKENVERLEAENPSMHRPAVEGSAKQKRQGRATRNGEGNESADRNSEIERRRQEEDRRKERVKEIDRLIVKGQAALLELQCEKDAIQRRPNPLYNYTSELEEDGTTEKHNRKFTFPPDDLVEEYLDELFSNGRLVKMNHTHLWRSDPDLDDDDDESIGDDLLTPSADAQKLYQQPNDDDLYSDSDTGASKHKKKTNGNGGGGSWLLRQSLGQKTSLGEKIGLAAETAGYKSICTSVMASLARSIAAIHGVNIMTHTDVRLYVEQAPDLPPLGRNVIPGSSSENQYAQEAIKEAMLQGMRKRKKKPRQGRMLSDQAFMQRDAVVETLISHCQISAPLLKLFPLAWQRALLANMITLIVAVVSDFCDGIQLQILGHSLTFAFRPITERDMIRHIASTGTGFNHRRARPEEFEAAVRATAKDVSDGLKFLDRWHERLLGSGHLRAQIANLIARIVLTLADEVLSGAKLDLWSAQAGGPRMVAGLEYRTTPEPVDESHNHHHHENEGHRS